MAKKIDWEEVMKVVSPAGEVYNVERAVFDLPVKFTLEEMEDLIDEYVGKKEEEIRIEADFALAKQKYKVALGELGKTVSDLEKKISARAHEESTVCECAISDDGRVLHTIRLDTGEPVKFVGHPKLNIQPPAPYELRETKGCEIKIWDAGKWEILDFKKVRQGMRFQMFMASGKRYEAEKGVKEFVAVDSAKMKDTKMTIPCKAYNPKEK